jgi:hypothetical protein
MTSLAESTDNISRNRFLLIINAAIEGQSYRFARQIGQTWLSRFPGDLEIGLLLGISLLGEGNRKEAFNVLDKICQRDPEFPEVHQALYLAADAGSEQSVTSSHCANILGNPIYQSLEIPEWCSQLRQAYQLFNNSSFEEAETLTHKVLGVKPNLTLAAVLHLKIAFARHEEQTINQLANLYHTRWPDCLQFKLCLAQAKMDMGDETIAVDLLHECVATDACGVVPGRLWGENHRYLPLWPESFEMPFDFAIPASVATVLGWNMLTAGECETIEKVPLEIEINESKNEEVVSENNFEIHDETLRGSEPVVPELTRPHRKMVEDETLRSVEEAFASIAKKLNRPTIARADGRFPVYIVMSIKSRLIEQYGQQTTSVIENEMQHLAEAIGLRPRWGSLVFFPDAPDNAREIGLNPVDLIDPWKIKLALVDLDTILARKGEMIGALLIVGGAEVVPYHMLPNPTDDVDIEVASDNPYATLDSNYFIPEWPVGRLPGEIGPDAGLLLDQLRRIVQNHRPIEKTNNILIQISTLFKDGKIFQNILRFLLGSKTPLSFGYSASVWKQTSLAVYKLIGEPTNMLASPPEFSGSFASKKITDPKLGYFNLHGLVDSPDWYGQREITSQDYPDYPVAISPRDIEKNGHSPSVIFTEACYGANIINKKESDALSLRFLALGTPAIVGSTCVSYGSVNSPLIGADLLGYLFWKHLRSGYTVGEALMQAKVDLAREMDHRQGFLDGEDQKTLISFILFGDPLVGLDSTQIRAKYAMRSKTHPSIKTISDFDIEDLGEPKISPEAVKEVKQMVETYLPGLDEAKVAIRQQLFMGIEGNLNNKAGMKEKNAGANGRMVVTISKHIEQSQYIHHHYARVTLNHRGKIVKLALSK